MKWSEITFHTTHEATEAVANIFHEAGASGVVIEDSVMPVAARDTRFGELYDSLKNDGPAEGVIIKAYLPVNDDLADAMKEIQQAIVELPSHGLQIGRHEIQTNEVNDEDWATAWKKYYHPVKISDRFTIVPTWEEYLPGSENELIIDLDPGMAFGTGTHPTTVLCMQALEKHLRPGDIVVDVGTGSGILAIGAALLEAKKVHALDLDPVAVTAAKENVDLNEVDDIVDVIHGDLLASIQVEPSLIVSNILADVIMSFSKDAASLLPKDGLFIVSGIIEDKKTLVENDLKDKGFEIIESIVKEEWVALVARKRSV